MYCLAGVGSGFRADQFKKWLIKIDMYGAFGDEDRAIFEPKRNFLGMRK